MPATFFIVGKTLEESPSEYRALLDDPLFEVASHSYSHGMLRDHPICGPAGGPEKVLAEVRRGKAVVEDVFGRACNGFRPGCGYTAGLHGMPEVLDAIQEAGYRYVSSLLWGDDYSLPAPLAEPFSYAVDGHPGINEYPASGWHENLLKGNNRVFGQKPIRTVLFPMLFPDAVPPRPITTVEEEMRYNNRYFIEAALAAGSSYVTLIWHPWSLGLFDPPMRMLELTFEMVRARGLQPCTFEEMDRQRRAGG
jgi:peptidoglycan/xylan/chitin deacetylase (PgdA/CDA1 family)